jgi:superfamily I DNA/RNA helicase
MNTSSEIPVEGNETRKLVSAIKKMLKNIEQSIADENDFYSDTNNLATYLGYVTKNEHLKKLFKTVINKKYHVAFKPDKYQHIAITFHSSKGLEFEQVIIFAEDYHLSDLSSLYNHYVAVTRAKSKLIIMRLNNYKSNLFQNNLEKNIC